MYYGNSPLQTAKHEESVLVSYKLYLIREKVSSPFSNYDKCNSERKERGHRIAIYNLPTCFHSLTIHIVFQNSIYLYTQCAHIHTECVLSSEYLDSKHCTLQTAVLVQVNSVIIGRLVSAKHINEDRHYVWHW
jgi:hypothetical protein